MKNCRNFEKLYIVGGRITSKEKVSHDKEIGLGEFLVCGTVSFAVHSKLLREKYRKYLVKGNQVLSVCPALKLVLSSRSQETKRRLGRSLTVLRREISAHPRRTCTNFHAIENKVRLASVTNKAGRKSGREPRLCVSFMLAFIPWPALGECVWQASPAMKTRSCAVNFEATRCPTGRNSSQAGITVTQFRVSKGEFLL
jgi:hypothetical protein